MYGACVSILLIQLYIQRVILDMLILLCMLILTYMLTSIYAACCSCDSVCILVYICSMCRILQYLHTAIRDPSATVNGRRPTAQHVLSMCLILLYLHTTILVCILL